MIGPDDSCPLGVQTSQRADLYGNQGDGGEKSAEEGKEGS